MGLTFLYIDDDQEDQEFFSMAIEQLGKPATVFFAESGRNALNLLSTGLHAIPDFIFLDLNMPLMNGYQTLEALAQLPALHATNIIIYSDYVLEERETLATIGAKDMIRKFVSVEHLKKYLSLLAT
ncbi:response regulator [Pinibacter aurantiacus]|uniref:Response regulator n=1 Tax=Pinibacter aurantiacus TaxID=2851599 RepID=A0A9E2SEE5_9BACT|nr:response regulator [Pinibacter aurantiacus]MBV4359090.1 response regulator [Pinibacter aurantiacus]